MAQDVYIYRPGVPVPKDVQHVEIPDGVTVIEEEAFYKCSALQDIVIPDSVKEIGDAAFLGCKNLQAVTIPHGVTVIPYNAFGGCSSLRSVTIPDSVTKIGSCAFSWCSALQSLMIPGSVKKIGPYAFNHTGLWSVTLPDGLEEINARTFEHCSELRDIRIPDSVTKIGVATFADCDRLEAIKIPDKVTAVSRMLFYRCSRLQSVSMSENTKKIGSCAFMDCSVLRSLTIPDSVTKIGYRSFSDCAALQSVTIPDNVTKIEYGAFEDCTSLQSVTIPAGVTKIDWEIFSGCTSLQSVTVPDTVTSIGKRAFEYCPGLRSVTLPDGIKKIKNSAFSHCPNLQSVLFKGADIAPYTGINEDGANTFRVVRTLIDAGIPLSMNTVMHGIKMKQNDRLPKWIKEYPTFGTMDLSRDAKNVSAGETEHLRRCFAARESTGHYIPKDLDVLAATMHACGIPAERMAAGFDPEYTANLRAKKIPVVPAEACRCYYDRDTCDMLIREDRADVMGNAISLYNASGHEPCYKHAMTFIAECADAGPEDLRYAVDHAKEIPMEPHTALEQVRQHRADREAAANIPKDGPFVTPQRDSGVTSRKPIFEWDDNLDI